MKPQLLINAIVQQTVVFIAQLAISGGVRAPLAHIADQVFLELTRELGGQGVTKKVIADMFGMSLRTYHRRTQAAEQSQSVSGQTVWEAVLRFLAERQPVSGSAVLQRFSRDDVEIVTGVLNDFVNSGLAYRAGRGDAAVYRLAPPADFADPTAQADGERCLVWLCAYRSGPISRAQLGEQCNLAAERVDAALEALLAAGQVSGGEGDVFSSERFEVPWEAEHGWEAAVLDHYQALIRAVSTKLRIGRTKASLADAVGGSTWTLDVGPGHPHEAEARDTLQHLRRSVEALREKIDAHNAEHPPAELDPVVVYLGQYVNSSGASHE
ncbi:MAG: hypothetical protein ABI895_37515 [Deltaproteobacteria bacterium]